MILKSEDLPVACDLHNGYERWPCVRTKNYNDVNFLFSIGLLEYLQVFFMPKIKLSQGELMKTNSEKRIAILAVSFGTSHNDTRKVTIDAIEEALKNACPNASLYRAWTSKMIIKKVNARDNAKIMTVSEAMEQMKQDGISDVLVQPTHVINGIENDLMKEDALAYKDSFHSISFGAPLLTSEEDTNKVIDILADEFSWLDKKQALVFMGHGTTHFSNSIYAALDYAFKDKGHPNIFLATVEAYPSIDSLKRLVDAYKPEEIVLAPFMIVAGDHAKNDMAGDDPDSWYSKFKAAGYQVKPVLKGLGEYKGIQDLFVEHLKAIKP